MERIQEIIYFWIDFIERFKLIEFNDGSIPVQ